VPGVCIYAEIMESQRLGVVVFDLGRGALEVVNRFARTVLIVDDEDLFLRTVADGFAPHASRVNVLTASNGKVATEILGRWVHVEAEKAHILARCLNEGSDPLKSLPGKAHIHLVLVLKNDSAIGLAKLRVSNTIEKLAEDFRM
jgi:hypothetical protein